MSDYESMDDAYNAGVAAGKEEAAGQDDGRLTFERLQQMTAAEIAEVGDDEIAAAMREAAQDREGE